MDASVFTDFARLSGLVPLVGVGLGACFAGNATLLACCDVIIATENSTIGMTGPALVEASGMGSHTAEDLGSMSFQAANGDVDILVKDEAAAVEAVKTMNIDGAVNSPRGGNWPPSRIPRNVRMRTSDESPRATSRRAPSTRARDTSSIPRIPGRSSPGA